MSESEDFVRVFAGRGAGIAHLVIRHALEHVTFAPPGTLCGRARPYRSHAGWFGWKNINDIEQAKRLPLCKLCERKSNA